MATVPGTLGNDDPSDYYDILLVGRTGMGKSTTGNKLLGITYEPLAKLNETETVIASRDTADDAVQYFVIGDISESVTTECKLLPNERSYRVLDTPGFANSHLVKEYGSQECNQQICLWILEEQEQHDLAFRRVLYFLPNRGALERAEGALQEEIRVMYDFLGEDIFNVMIIIATNQKDEKCQIEFDEEDISTTQAAFTTAFESVIGQHLTKCPPVIYLPSAGTDVLKRIQSIEVIAEKPLSLKGNRPDPIKVMPKENVDYEVRKARQEHPGQRLQFQVKCLRCTCELIYNNFPSGRWVVAKTVDEKGDKVLLKKSKCHSTFIPKYYTIAKIIGGIAHIATLGTFAVAGWYWRKTVWPGFTNSDKICSVCNLPPGSIGCSVVGETLPVKGEENVNIVISHSTTLDKFKEAV